MAYTRRKTSDDATWQRAWTADTVADLATISAILGSERPHHGDIAFVTADSNYYLWLDNSSWAQITGLGAGSISQSIILGMDGIDGVDGFPIPGPAGATGTNGINGVNGSQGIPGMDGSAGNEELIFINPNPTQPPQCLAWNNGTVSVPNVTLTVLALDSEEFDINAMHNTVTNNSRVTIPPGGGGNYLIIGQTTWEPSGTGVRRLIIRKNGSGNLSEGDVAPSSSSRQTSHSVQTTKRLLAGDYFELIAFQESGIAINAGDTDVGTASALMCIKLSI